MLKFLPSGSRRELAARADGPPRRHPVLVGAGAMAASALAALTLMPAAGAATAAPQAPAPATLAAAAAPAVPTLDWQPCDSSFQCATAAVPLDYANPDGTKISIAVIKHPATDPAHRIGTLFFNPGGPGASGVSLMENGGYSLFPAAVRARFDVVSFDPRGIGQSTVLQCFDSNAQEQQLLGPAASESFPIGAAQQQAWDNTFARFDTACGTNAGPLLAHDSTADVARDMDLLRQAVGDPAMNYYGISYGSYLGATYANLFPSKVRAMVLDGNIDPVQWATGTGGSAAVLSTFLRLGSDEGTSAALTAFLTLCGQAPASSCVFSAGSPAATSARFATLLDRLASHPVTLAGVINTEAVAVSTAVGGLYSAEPVPGLSAGWSNLATFLEDLWTLTSGGPAPATVPSLPRDSALTGSGAQPDDSAPYSGLESGLGVICSDSPNPRDPAGYAAQAALASARSGVVGPDWTWPNEACAQWPVLAKDRYTGPFNRPTAAPILVVGNTVDPATPYQGSVAMSRDLADARLLTVDGYGHTEYANPSTCAATAEDSYFVSGTLPPPGTVCHQDTPPFAG